ncbi:MAG: type II secretion system protein M [Defluviitaleaceae bacterium]|nr:type II secretion system protein M [Defluviitaleaceae bacterium]
MPIDKKGFTKREKLLLILVAVVGITAIMVMYVIIPFYNRLEDSREAYNALSMERMQVEMIKATEASLLAGYQAAVLEYYELREVFLSEAHLSGIGLLLTRLTLEHNMHPVDQRLSNPVTSPGRDMLMVVTASMTLRGSYEDLKTLLDTVEETEYLRISHVAFSFGADGEISNVRVSFEVTMIRDV